MSHRLIVRPDAEMEIAEAFDWYQEFTPGLGSDFLLCVDAVFSAISRSPQQYPQVHKCIRRVHSSVGSPIWCISLRTTNASLCWLSSMRSVIRRNGSNRPQKIRLSRSSGLVLTRLMFVHLGKSNPDENRYEMQRHRTPCYPT